MNERIYAHDLWTRVCQEDIPELDETFMTMRRTRKFAELIVAECISKYDEWAEHSTDKTSFHLARHNIKKYFGVDS